MTNIISLLHDIENIEPIPVELPNGSSTLAIKRGKVLIVDELKSPVLWLLACI